VRDDAGARITKLQVAGVAGRGARNHLRGLPPGRYLLHVMDMQGKELTAIEVEADVEDGVLR